MQAQESGGVRRCATYGIDELLPLVQSELDPQARQAMLNARPPRR